MITKEDALKNIEDWFEELKQIYSHYSSKDVWVMLKSQYHYIIFTNFIKNWWDINSWAEIYNFLDFFWLNLTNRDKLVFFYLNFHFYWLWYFELTGNKSIEKYNIVELFQNDIYIKLKEKDLENVCIIPAKCMNHKKFYEDFYKWYIEGFFETIYFTYYDNDLIDSKYRYDKKIIINTISYLYNVLWDEFEISKEMFQKKQEISFMEFVICYSFLWFIEITGLSTVYEENTKYWIRILPDFKKILDEIEEKRSLILDKVFDEKYNEIKIKKQKWEISFIEWQINIYWDDTKFVDLKKQYPFSKIETDIHKWKINKYSIKEKIKLKGGKE